MEDGIYIVTVKTEHDIKSECYHTLNDAMSIAENIVNTQEHIYVLIMMVNTKEGKSSVVKLYGAYND